MVHPNQKGFTIIEVVLFLALSGLFLTIAFAGIRGRTENIQFTDSMRSLQSFLVSEQNKLTNGVNSSPLSPQGCGSFGGLTGKSNGCILLGRVVSFGKNNSDLSEVKIDVLYGAKPSSLEVSSKDDYALIKDSNPRTDNVVDTYNISWGTEFNIAKSSNANTADNYDRIGWLRSPGSTRIIPIAFSSSVDGLKSKYFSKSDSASMIGDEVDTKLCFVGNSGTRVASINFGDGQGSSSFQIVFDDGACL